MEKRKIPRITKEGLDKLKSYSVEKRTRATKLHFGYFCAYYFKHSINYAFCDDHYEMFADVHDLLDGVITDLVWIGYRESAKTWVARCFFIYCLVYRLDDYLNVDSYDGDNSEAFLFDGVIELQTNKRLIEDFGQIYNAPRSKDENTKKRQDDFITNPLRDEDGNTIGPGIRVEAHTTQESVRGRQHNGKRPGILILDDFENWKTVKSQAITESVWSHIKEFKTGLDSLKAKKLYLGNYISQFANIQKLIDMQKNNPKVRVRMIPIIRNGKPTWSEKYVMTDAEAEEFILQNPLKRPKISLQAKKVDMWDPDTGDMTWEAEMMCNPVDNDLAIFKREYFKSITLSEVLAKDVQCFVTLDPALSESKKSDDTGVSILFIDADNNWYLKSFGIRVNSKQFLAFLFLLHAFLMKLGVKPKKIGIEKEKYFSAIFPFLKEKLIKADSPFSILPLDIKGRNKEKKITDALQYRYENGQITHILGDMKFVDQETEETGKVNAPYNNSAYETQALRFPAGDHDDMLDATSYMADIATFYVETKEEKEEKSKKNPYDIDAWVESKSKPVHESVYEDDDEDDSSNW